MTREEALQLLQEREQNVTVEDAQAFFENPVWQEMRSMMAYLLMEAYRELANKSTPDQDLRHAQGRVAAIEQVEEVMPQILLQTAQFDDDMKGATEDG